MKMKKKYQILILFLISIFVLNAQKGTLGRITFTSGGVSSSKISVSVGESMSGTYRSPDGKIDFTIGSQIGARTVIQKVDTLLVDKSLLSSPSSGGKYSVILTSNRDWSLVANASWITVTPKQGVGKATLSVTISPNTSTVARSGKIDITAGTLVKTITVNQAAATKVDTLLIDKSSITALSSGTNSTIKLTSNRDWSLVTNASWITVNPKQGVGNASLSVSISPNTSAIARSGKIDITAGALVKTIAVNQAGVENPQDQFEIAYNDLKLTYQSSDTTLKVTSNRNWEIKNPSDWLVFSANQGTGNALLTLYASKNSSSSPRSTIVVFTAGTTVRVLDVMQDGYLGVNKMDMKELINIFPNPVATELTVAIDSKLISKTTITILDATGKVISSIVPDAEKNTIDVSEYASGNYYLHVVNQENNINEKIMFNKLNR